MEETTSTLKPPLTVEVIATRDWDKGVDFLCRWQSPQDVWHSGPMVFAKGDPDRKIEYNLIDKTGLNLAFLNSVDDAIWVSETDCPTSPPPSGSDKGQITERNLQHSKQLKLKNKNTETCELHYALRFTGDPWEGSEAFTPPYEYDPEYRNSGGAGSNTGG